MYSYKAKVINVVDGDTFDAEVDLGFRLKTTQRFRLVNCNCPELHGPDKVKGLLAKDFTVKKLLNNEVEIRTFKSDDWGRWLALVTLDSGTVFNKLIVEQGFAVPFMEHKQYRDTVEIEGLTLKVHSNTIELLAEVGGKNILVINEPLSEVINTSVTPYGVKNGFTLLQ